MLRGADGPHTSLGVLILNEDLDMEGRRLMGRSPKVGAKCPSSEEIRRGDSEKFTSSVFNRADQSPIGRRWYTSQISSRLQ